jgi:CheY-like chemotaxis protein/HPt (histidine-containing phosphotransfer) domain-containing protein
MSEPAATILVVDDHRLTAELTGLALESSGFEVVIDEDGPSALARLAADGSIRAIVSDMNMPGMDGLALLDALRQRGFTQPFILLTGEEGTARFQGHPGLDAVLIKDEQVEKALPLRLAELLQGTAPEAVRPGPKHPGFAPPALPGLDLEASLKALNHNWELLKGLLQAFGEEYRTAAGDYRRLREAGDTAQCLAELHVLKGAAGMLGATRLPSAIADLEKAIRSDQDPPCWAAFEACLGEVLGGIQGI